MRRFITIIFRTSLTLAVLIAAFWLFSQFYMTSFYNRDPRGISFMAYRQSLFIDNGGLYRSMGLAITRQLNTNGLLWPRYTREGDNYLVDLPFWIPLLVSIFPAALLWPFRHRRFRAPACSKCGYNLTANLSGTCPECGTPVTPSAQPSPSSP